MPNSKAVPVADLTIPTGWRSIGSTAALAKAMARDGQQVPIVIDPSGFVLAGHRRLAANREDTILAVVVETIWELFDELERQNAENARWFSALTDEPKPYDMMVMTAVWHEWDAEAAHQRRSRIASQAKRGGGRVHPVPRRRNSGSALYDGYARALGITEWVFNQLWQLWRYGHGHPIPEVRDLALRELSALESIKLTGRAYKRWRDAREIAEQALQSAPSPERTRLNAFAAQLRGAFAGLGDIEAYGVTLPPFERRVYALELERYKTTLHHLVTQLRKDTTS